MRRSQSVIRRYFLPGVINLTAARPARRDPLLRPAGEVLRIPSAGD
jgi:hypothetical protein